MKLFREKWLTPPPINWDRLALAVLFFLALVAIKLTYDNVIRPAILG